MADNAIQISSKLPDGTIVVIGGSNPAEFLTNAVQLLDENAAETIRSKFVEALVPAGQQFAQAQANVQAAVQQYGTVTPITQAPSYQPVQDPQGLAQQQLAAYQQPVQQFAPQQYAQPQQPAYPQQGAYAPQAEAPRADGPPPGQFCDPKDPTKTKWVPGGVSKKTGKPYAGFWAAP